MRNLSILLIILLCSVAPAQAAQVQVEPAYLEVSQGANFTVNIMVDPEGSEVMGAQYDLYFNSTLLNATEQTPGTFLGGIPFVDDINNTIGRIMYGEFRTGTAGVTTPGMLTSITFEVIAERGVCELLLDNVILSDSGAAEIPGVNVSSGTVEIVDGICGDVNGDSKVNIGDVIRLANHVGFPDDPKYYPFDDDLADVNNDNKVNIGDVIRLANHVGFPDDPRYTPI